MYIRLGFDQLGGTEELAIDQIQVRGNSTLPVKLLYFNGRSEGLSDYLNWKIEDPAEAERFILERSTDGIGFLPFRTILPGSAMNYETTALVNLSGIRFYRLRITEITGREILSPVLRLGVLSDAWQLKVLYPAGLVGSRQISIQAPVSGAVSLQLLGSDGQVSYRWSLHLMKGNTVLPVPVLPAGVYLLLLTAADGAQLRSIRFQQSGFH